MWNFILGVFMGFVIGIIPLIIVTIRKDKPAGDLVVDRSDEDGPLLFLELNEPLNRVEDKEKVERNLGNKYAIKA